MNESMEESIQSTPQAAVEETLAEAPAVPFVALSAEPAVEPPVVEALLETPVEAPVVPKVEPKPCRHEYVRIYQRRLKGLDRRLVSTRAYNPLGFKTVDLGHLSEGSYCFCTGCRTRLIPRRTTAEKAAARIINMQAKAGLTLAALAASSIDETALNQFSDAGDLNSDAGSESDPLSEKAVDVHVDELELEAVDVQDIEAEGVKIVDEDAADCLSGDEDI